MAPGSRLVCEAWCATADVIACAPCSTGAPFDAAKMADAIDVASDILYLLSGRQFPGVCSDTVRPNHPGSGCGIGIGSVSVRLDSSGGTSYRDYSSDRNLAGGPEILLPGYPVVAITSVTIDGVLLAPSAYRIDDDRWLSRIDGEGWPLQDDRAMDSFLVVYTYGIAIPPMARRAAAAYACQVLKACLQDSSCSLPPRTQSVVRQGLSANTRDPNDYIDNGKTGVDEADRFIKAVNPNGLQERAAVLSPDVNWPAHRLR
jgi:hypothetical protein